MSVYKQLKLKDLNYGSLLLWNKDLLRSVNLEIKVITENDTNPVNDQIYILFYKNSNLIGHASYSELDAFGYSTKK